MKLFTFLLAAAAISADSLTAQFYDCPCDRSGNGGIFYQWIYGPADRRYNEKRAKIVGEMEAKSRADAVTAKSIHELDEEVMALRNLVLSGKASEADRELLKRKSAEVRVAAAAFYGKP